MGVYKYKTRKGKTAWFYHFNAPGSTRENRTVIKKRGFETKQAAIDAEAVRRTEVNRAHEFAQAGRAIDAPIPKTLGALLAEFLDRHVEEELAPKTVERYREQAAYLSVELLELPLADLTPLHFAREWRRLLKSGGHTRKDKAPRPMSPKTVRNIAGVVSAAYGRGIKWGLVATNPVTNSEPPVLVKREGFAFLPAEQDLMRDTASGPWCLPVFIETAAASGARRGETLALRWSDLVDGRLFITRSLSQTRKDGLIFRNTTKNKKPRVVSLPDSALAMLKVHRKQQDEFRRQFGADYRADLDLIFANPDGSPLRPDSISASISALCRRLKLPKGASLHTLRHSHGSHLLANGVPLPVVSERLGHSSVRVTADVYSHALRGQDDEAARKWEEFQQRNRAAISEAKTQDSGRVQ